MLFYKQLNRKVQLLFPMVAYVIAYLYAFHILEEAKGRHYHILQLALDDSIPFIPAFIVPYVLWFFFVPGVTLYLLFHDERAYVRLSFLLAAGMTVFLAVSLIFPTKLYLRPEVFLGNDIFYQITAFLYHIDTPTNVLPSIHVYNTLATYFVYYDSQSGEANNTPSLWQWHSGKTLTVKDAGHRSKKQVFVLMGMELLSVLIVLSTMFLKQHSIIDVLAATLMFIVLNKASLNSRLTRSIYERYTGSQKV